MDANDVDMMDSDAPAAPLSRSPELSSVSDQIQVARGLLTVARQLIDQGKPSEALQAVLSAMRAKGGEAAAFEALNRAKELYINKIQETTAADELASLLAECAIIEESSPTIPQPPLSSTSNNTQSVDGCILEEMGRKQIVMDAFCDGSSFVCVQCGGLVGNDRRDEHYAFWCGR